MIRSVRLTLTLWYISILAIILCVFGGVLYTSVQKSLAQDVDALLVSQAEGVSEAIYSFWEAQQSSSVHHASIHQDVEAGKLPELVKLWAKETGELETIRPVRLTETAGGILISSSSFEKLSMPLSAEAIFAGRNQRTTFESFEFPNHLRFRVVTRPVIEDAKVLYLVQVASSLIQMDTSIKRFRLWLLGLIPATLISTSIVGWFLASLALRPIRGMMIQVRQLRMDTVSKRIDVPSTGDEIERLAVTFNQMLERIDRTFQRLRQFSAAASHELRTPLTIMKGELEVALRKPRDREEYQRVLRTHLETLNDMARIVEELLTLARSEAGEGAVEWKRVELTPMIENACAPWYKNFDAKSVSLNIESRDKVFVRGEIRLLERLVSNLLDNALKHTPSGGRVVVGINRNQVEVCLSVQDSGTGISTQDLPGIFENFFAGTSTKSNGETSGFGLGLCRWIAEVHQGRIEIESSPGKGAIFAVWLPLAS